MPHLGWSTPLTRSIQVKDGPALRTLNDARVYMLDHLPEEAKARHSWQKAAELLLAAAEGLDDVGAATGQVELAIFLQIKLLPQKLKARKTNRDKKAQLCDGAECHDVLARVQPRGISAHMVARFR